MEERDAIEVGDNAVDLVSRETKDALLSYSVPADHYLDVLKEIDEVMQRHGCKALEAEGSGVADHSAGHQNRRVIDYSHAHYYSTRMTLSDVDLRIIEYLWEREGKPLFKKDIADDLGYTLPKVEYSLRKKLKHQGLVTVVRHTDERHANGANSYFVDKSFVLEKISKMIKGVTLDLSAYDVENIDEVASLFLAAEDLFLSYHALKEGETTLSDYLAGDVGLRAQISVGEAVRLVCGVTPSRASTILDGLDIDPSRPLGEIGRSEIAKLLAFEKEVSN